MRKALVCALVCICAVCANATTIVLVRTPQPAFFAAADEMTTRNTSHQHRMVCKFQREGNVYFTTGDLSLIGDARDAIKHSSTIAESAQTFSSNSELLNHWFVTAFRPEQIAQAAKGGYSFTVNEAAWWGIEKGVPKYVFARFWATSKTTLGHSLEVCPDDCRQFRCIGYCDILFASLPNSDPTDPAALKAFVMAEEKLHPDVVGGPVDVLTLDATGAHWSDGGMCSAPEASQPKPHHSQHKGTN